MRFCTRMLLTRTRRILVEIQADIEKATKPKRRHRAHKFTEIQLRIAREWHERHGRPFTILTRTEGSGHLTTDVPDEILCPADHCFNSWDANGVADEYNKEVTP